MKNSIFREKFLTLRKFHLISLNLFVVGLMTLSTSIAQTGEALNFDGVDDYINLPFVVQNSYTKEAWVKISAIDGNTHNIISGSGSAFFIVNGQLSAGHSPTFLDVQDPGTLSLNVWHHVAVTYDHTSNTMTLYKDGVAVALGTSISYTDTENYIGAVDIGYPENFFIYNIDEVRIWRTALTAGQITAYSTCSLLNNETNLSAHYTFNQGTAIGNNIGITTLLDSGPNGYHGSISGFALTGSSSNFVGSGVSFSGPCGVLPVEIISFKAEKSLGNQVRLEWKTAAEQANTYYYVERSSAANGDWKQIAKVTGQVSSAPEKTYYYNDATPGSGVNYYRIRQVISTGSEKYSAVRNVKFDEAFKNFAVYPTLTGGQVTIEVSDPSLIGTSLLLVDNMGRVVGKQIISQVKQPISISNFPNGMYFIRNAKGETAKVIKQ
ncbi:hypothetical protein BH20BAC1_BH20BAC1_14880 [soil metagenome]